jgi:hypothetical protein
MLLFSGKVGNEEIANASFNQCINAICHNYEGTLNN